MGKKEEFLIITPENSQNMVSYGLRLITKELKKIAATGQEEAKKLLPKAYKAIDKAAKIGIIKKNKAARLKSSAAKLLAKK